MTTQISWQVELAIAPGQLDNFRALTEEMVAYTKTETGALVFERFLSEDGRTVCLYERYADSAAAVAHLRAFDDRFADRFNPMIERKRFVVCGAPSDDLRGILDGIGVTYMGLLDGFSR